MVLEILKLVLPSLLVLLAAWLMLRAFLNKEADTVKGLLVRDTENRRIELLQSTSKAILPLRLQAYERMTLFCTRIEMGQLISNTNANAEMSAELYKMALLSQVEEEFNHNITQQVYLTDDLWNIIQLAKKEALQICEKVFQDLRAEFALNGNDANPNAKDYLEALVKYIHENPQIGYLHALTAIKKEVGVLF